MVLFMKNIKIGEFHLCSFDKNNKNHMLFLKKILKDDSVIKRFQGFLPHLLKDTNDIFDKGFFVSKNNELIGYVDFDNFSKEEQAVYIRQMIDKEKRGLGYGSSILSEVCNYVFKTYPFVTKVKARIAKDNVKSIMMAYNAGFINDIDDYYTLSNPSIKQDNKKL